MVELFEEYPWVEEMMLVISQVVLRTAPWGVVWRVFVGARLSIGSTGGVEGAGGERSEHKRSMSLRAAGGVCVCVCVCGGGGGERASERFARR
jgi:hypothetical protein